MHKPDYTRRGWECSIDDNALKGCPVDDDSGHRLIIRKGYSVHVPRSINCYSCGPCTKDGMSCANKFRLD